MITGRDDIGSYARLVVIHRRPITRRITTVNIRARIITVIRYAGAGCARWSGFTLRITVGTVFATILTPVRLAFHYLKN